MHRVRQALPYLEEMGWKPVVITVEEKYIESYSIDPLLALTIPPDIEVHKVKAFPVKRTRKIGLGSLSLRSYWFIKRKGDELLAKEKFDLVYFSTTAFHVMALGPVWKKKFNVPFIVDMQDPWRNDFYLDKPANQRPPKFLIAYNIDKYLEAKTIPFADGIISVSQGYCDTFIKRYPAVTNKRCRVVPFGVADADIEVMRKYVTGCKKVALPDDKVNIVYVGRGGYDMAFALNIVFNAFAKALETDPAKFSKWHFWFIGTSYAPEGTGRKTITPVAEENNVGAYVTEITDRVPYFEGLYLLDKADILFIPGSTDITYTASKLYPYIILQKKMLAVFNEQSSVVRILNQLQYGKLVSFDHSKNTPEAYSAECLDYFNALTVESGEQLLNEELFEPYKAYAKTKAQVDFFNEVIAVNA